MQRPFSFSLTNPALHSQPTTQLAVQATAEGFPQIWGQAEPQGLNTSLAGHLGVVGGLGVVVRLLAIALH
jgi:hypothetical protein